MRNRLSAFLLLGLALLLSSCEEMEFTEFFELGPLRVLTVVADPPEIAHMDSSTDVTLTPYVSDIDAAGRTLSVEIQACLDPGIGFGEEPTCDGSEMLDDSIDYNDVDTSSLGPTFTGALPSVTVPVPGNLLDGLSETDKERGLDYLVTFVFRAGSEEIQAYKRIHVSTASSKNQNPVLNAILVNGSSEAMSIGEGDNVDVSADTPETYTAIDFSDNRTEEVEEYLVSWFTYGGTTEFTRTSVGTPTVWEESETETSFKLLVAILRDNRGGIDVTIREF